MLENDNLNVDTRLAARGTDELEHVTTRIPAGNGVGGDFNQDYAAFNQRTGIVDIDLIRKSLIQGLDPMIAKTLLQPSDDLVIGQSVNKTASAKIANPVAGPAGPAAGGGRRF